VAGFAIEFYCRRMPYAACACHRAFGGARTRLNVQTSPLSRLHITLALRRSVTAMTDLSVGDRVSWNTSQGRTRGKILERKESDFQFAGQKFTASSSEPAFMVQSEKTGAKAAHKASALRKLKS
jgi:hypothetical protein